MFIVIIIIIVILHSAYVYSQLWRLQRERIRVSEFFLDFVVVTLIKYSKDNCKDNNFFSISSVCKGEVNSYR